MGPLLIKYVTEELNKTLAGGVISKIHQPDEKTLVLKIFVRGTEERLVISTHHRLGRIHLTSQKFENPPTPLRFCAFLRKRITNARVMEVRGKEGERIVCISLERKRPGEEAPESYTLRAELTGKSGNIILLDDTGVVCDAMRYFPAEKSVRAVEPGLKLADLPPVKAAAEETLPEKGFKESWNEAADRFYADLMEVGSFASERARLRRVIKEAGKKAARKLKNLEGDEERANRALTEAALGELLKTNLNKVKRGMTKATLDDYTKVPPEKVTVPLDPVLSPMENAERFFKKARKGRTALKLLKGRIPGIKEEMEYLDSLSYELEEADTPGDLSALEKEFSKRGFIKKVRVKMEKEKEEVKGAEPVRRFTSSEGFEVLCGKSGAGNDLIVQKLAAGEDIWFHAANTPGSHVLIKVAGRGKELTRSTIEEAAALAAWHSRSRGAMKVEVTYAEARNVRKPRGAKPGLVTVRERKSITVKPKEMGEVGFEDA
jgi:predicted ribosome quality control (RQC) complex YloA/Tae2 family protein